MKCRFCRNDLTYKFIDLVNSPPSNAFLSKRELNEAETFYPLKIYVCDRCFLVQIDEYKESSEIFNQAYAYFSSYSQTWLAHTKRYVDMVTDRFQLGAKSLVMEIASNDGYLLQYFLQKEIPCLGIEPSSNTAIAAREKGVETLENFFGTALAKNLAQTGSKADLIIGNNVLAHVPRLNDFVRGLKIVLKPTGVITMEFPHLMRLVEKNQFDTIYHEHFSYFSFGTVHKIFAEHDMVIFDVEELETHGGSLRIYARHSQDNTHPVSQKVSELSDKETQKGMAHLDYYLGFQGQADTVKYALIAFLIEQKQKGKKVAAYGAAAKGNTLLNYCGVKKDLLEFVADASPHKQGKFLPGSHIPVVDKKEILKFRPDYILILPWNIQQEIVEQLSFIRKWGGKFVVPIPEIKVL